MSPMGSKQALYINFVRWEINKWKEWDSRKLLPREKKSKSMTQGEWKILDRDINLMCSLIEGIKNLSRIIPEYVYQFRGGMCEF